MTICRSCPSTPSDSFSSRPRNGCAFSTRNSDGVMLEALHPFGPAFLTDRHAAIAIERDLLERFDVALPIEIVGHAVVARSTPAPGYELLTVTSRSASGKRQRPQQHGVDDAENRRVGADAGGQREDGGERETLLLPEQAEAELDVLEKVTHSGLDEGGRVSCSHGTFQGRRVYGSGLRAPAEPGAQRATARGSRAAARTR